MIGIDENSYEDSLLVVLGLTALLDSISGRLPDRGKKKNIMIDERKNVQTAPSAPTASAIALALYMKIVVVVL